MNQLVVKFYVTCRRGCDKKVSWLPIYQEKLHIRVYLFFFSHLRLAVNEKERRELCNFVLKVALIRPSIVENATISIRFAERLNI